ncbi:post-PEP-CTERM-1 domain-containing protein [Ideonella oryzae]|uniref:Uncharacterized protein n=1 Tax=Ideonella oryzae TaxID=2937441 RepID=A0ABT1BMT5_9BURK|nr:hypothetical protein [Ideonella oryzae]MCO5976707.1 hypothetical protein [Ideonella oryzae]
MSIQMLAVPKPLLCVCLLVLSAAAAAQGEAEGMRVAKDPVTGQWRAVTPDEAKALGATAAGTNALRAAGGKSLRSLKAPAARGVTLGAEHLSSMRVAKDAQGHLVEECVEGDEAPMAAPMTQSQPQGAEIE